MRLLLTSRGLTNASIRRALVELIGKPIEQASALFVPTALHAMKLGGAYLAETLEEERAIGWQRLSVLGLTALPTLLPEHWLSLLEELDVIVVAGGNTPYLSYWFQHSGFADKLPELLERCVYVGVSAGSMVVTHSFGVNRIRLRDTGVYADDQYGDVAPPQAGSDFTAGLVDFTLRPHLNAEDFERVTRLDMERSAVEVDVPLYAIDDQSAIKVVNDRIEVVSEGEWILYEKGRARHEYSATQ
jgi:dipeptidase E